ncbi:MAG: transposase [Lewinella sp.]
MRKSHVILTDLDRNTLNELLRKGNLSVRVTKRCLALLALDRGQSYKEVAPLVGLTYGTTRTFGERFIDQGIDLIYDRPRSGRPSVLTGEAKAKITALACSDPGPGRSQWSLRLLAERAVELEYVESISHNEVGKILKKMNLSLTSN